MGLMGRKGQQAETRAPSLNPEHYYTSNQLNWSQDPFFQISILISSFFSDEISLISFANQRKGSEELTMERIELGLVVSIHPSVSPLTSAAAHFFIEFDVNESGWVFPSLPSPKLKL